MATDTFDLKRAEALYEKSKTIKHKQYDNSFIALRKGICEVLKPVKESLPKGEKLENIYKIRNNIGEIKDDKKFKEYFEKYNKHKSILKLYDDVLIALQNGAKPNKKAIVNYYYKFSKEQKLRDRTKEITDFFKEQLGMQD